MALADCVKDILCGLSSAVLRELQVIIDGQVAILQTQVTAVQAQLLQYDILSIPIQSANQVAQAAIGSVKKVTNLVPLNAISECVDLGDMNLDLNKSIDLASAAADEAAFELSRLVSYREELNALVTELNNTIDHLTEVRDLINLCLAGG